MKNAVITGATKGIGKAIAETFAAAGYNLALCARTAADLDTFAAELKEKNRNITVVTMPVDVRQKKEVQAFGAFVRAHFERVDVLVNNAGVFMPGAITEEPDGNLELMIETNLYSAYYLSRALAPVFIQQADGLIFNMCSIASFMAYPNGGSYSISKFALLGMSKVLREELKPHGVKVTTVMPGATWSNSWAGFDAPNDRLMKPEDIAATMLAIAQLSQQSVVEELVIRPQLGDL